MRRRFAAILSLASCVFCMTALPVLAGAAAAPSPDEAHATLAILETTDIHAHVVGYDYDRLAADPQVGLDRVATLIERARRQFPDTLLFDDGDTIQGTALADFQALSHPLACHQELAVYVAMDLMHYDAGTLGNHEFNYGLPFLSQVTGTPMHLPNVPVEHCDGPHYPLVLSNVVRASDGQPIYQPWLLLEREITVTDAQGNAEKVPIRIGVLGFTPPPVMQWDHAHLAGKVKALGVVEAAQRFLPELEAQHPDLVIALLHGGLDTRPYTPEMENAGWHLAGLPGIDVVLLGHSHAVFPDPGDPESRFRGLPQVDDVRGFVRGKPAVMGGFYGKDLGVVELALTHRGGRWSIDHAATHSEVWPTCAGRNRCVAADPRIDAAVAQANAATIDYVQTPIGASDFRMSSYFADVGDLSAIAVVNAAQLAYAKQHLFDSHPELRGLPMLSAASAFKTGFAGPKDYTDVAPGPLSLRSAADLYLYANTLSVVKLDGAGVKAWLEHSAERFNRIDPGHAAPQALIDRRFPGYDFDVIEGAPDDDFHYEIDVSKPIGQRIVALTFRGRPLDPGQTFLIVTNSYRAEGGGHFPGLDGSATVWAAPDPNRDAVIDYVRAHKTLRRADFAWRPWRFAPLRTRGPVTFVSAANRLDVAHSDGLDDVALLHDHGNGTATYTIDLAR